MLLVIHGIPTNVGFVFSCWSCGLVCTTVELLHLFGISTGLLRVNCSRGFPESWSVLSTWWRLTALCQIGVLINTWIFHLIIWVSNCWRLGSRVGETWRATIVECIVFDCYCNITSVWSIHHWISTFIFSRVVLDFLIIRLKLAVETILFSLLLLQNRIWVEWSWWWSLVGISHHASHLVHHVLPGDKFVFHLWVRLDKVVITLDKLTHRHIWVRIHQVDHIAISICHSFTK